MSNLQKERIIKEKLQKLIERIRLMKEVDNDHVIKLVKERINELQQRGICGIDKFLQKLFDSAHNKEDYLDILMEGRFAIILARLGFKEIHIEYCEAGPDLKANYNDNTVYFEITRRRPTEDDQAAEVGATVISRDRTENIISKIQGKLRQLQSDEINIVVVWSDTIRLSQHELEKAFEHIKQEIKDDPEKYKDLSAILFTEGEESYRTTLKKFYLLKNDEARKLLGICLTRKLKSLQKQNPKKLQKEWEAIAAAMKRLELKGN